MITFGTQPAKSEEDGMYYVRASREGKKVFIQLNKVDVVSSENGTVTLNVGENNLAKVQAIDDAVLAAALENSNAWFGRDLMESTLAGTYTKSLVGSILEVDRIHHTRVFDANLEPTSFADIQEGKKLNVIAEFGGLWFAKKSFGPVWNLVQAKIHSKPQPEYPEDPVFEDDDA